MFTLKRKPLSIPSADQALPGRSQAIPTAKTHFVSGAPLKGPYPEGAEKALFGLGCFWGAERKFWQVPGVYITAVGYAGGLTPNPTYEEVSEGSTGHAEAVEVVYDPAKVTYETLLEVFWRNIDPLTPDAQFCDHGSQYRSAIFTHGDAQKRLAEASKAALAGRFTQPIVTEIVAATRFYPAETYHQDYYSKNPLQYTFYRWQCGRDRRLEELWGKPPAG